MNASGRKVLSLSGARIDAGARPRHVVQVTQQAAYIAPGPTAEELEDLYARLAGMSLKQRGDYLRAVGHRYGVYDDDLVAERAAAENENAERAHVRYLEDLTDAEDCRPYDDGTVAPDFFRHSLATDFACGRELADLRENVGYDDAEGDSAADQTKRREALTHLALAVHANLERKTRGKDKGATKASDEAVAAGIDLAVREVCRQRSLQQASDIAKQAKVRYQTLLAIKDEALGQIQRLGITDALLETA